MSAPNFVSGGLNPNWDAVCATCPFLTRSPTGDGGWCSHSANRVPPMPGWPKGFTPSVFSTGGCDLHPARSTGRPE